MPDHIVYTDEGEPIPWDVPEDHLRVWGWDSEAAIVGDTSLGIDPAEWSKIAEQEADDAARFFGDTDEPEP